MATCSEYCSELLRAALRVCVCKQSYQSVDDDRTVTCRCAICCARDIETAEWTCASTLSVFRVAQ